MGYKSDLDLGYMCWEFPLHPPYLPQVGPS
jgi:hypothetical protein